MNASNSAASQSGWELTIVSLTAFPAVLYVLMLSAVLVANSLARRRGCEDNLHAVGSQHAQMLFAATPLVVALASASLSLPMGCLVQTCVTATPLVFIFASLGLVPDMATAQNLAPPNARRLFNMRTVFVATIMVFAVTLVGLSPDMGSTIMTLTTEWAVGVLSLLFNLVAMSGEPRAHIPQVGIATGVVTCVLSRAWHKNLVVPQAAHLSSAEVRPCSCSIVDG